MSIQPWKQIADDVVVHDGWIRLIKREYMRGDGETMQMELTARKDALDCNVIALTPEHKVVIARQFRCGPGVVMDELPGGFVDEGETSQQSVLRELKEETGYTSSNIKKLGRIHRNAYSMQATDVFIAYDCTPHSDGQTLDEGEEIEVQLISIEDLFANAKSGRLTDVGSIFLAYDTLKSLQGEHKTS